MGSSVNKADGEITATEEPQPVFSFSLIWATAGFAFSLALASVLAGRYSLLLSQPAQMGNSIGVLTFIVAMLVFSLVGISQSLLQPVWSAKFYSNHAVISGRRLQLELDYSLIEQVSLATSWRTWPFVTRLSILPKGWKAPIVLGFNPSKRDLGTNLGSWLDGKIHE